MRQIHIIVYAFMFIATSAAASGQAPEGYVVTDEYPQQRHAGVGMSGHETWLMNNYQDYVYTLDQVCYCTLPKRARVYVIGGKVVQVEDVKTGHIYSDPDMLKNFRTIPGYLELIDALVLRHPDSLCIKYNRSLGYPELIKADLSFRTADEEVDYQISDFRFLKKP